jgi:hypothetical protein
MPNKLVVALSLVIFTGVLTDTARAESSDDVIYREALKSILDFQKPGQFAVWSQKIPGEIVNEPRVPRQNPYKQLSRSLPGLPPSLEQELLKPADDADERSALPKFAMPTSTPAFIGFLDRAALDQAQTSGDHNDLKAAITSIGFSRVAYGYKGQNSLLYAENCLTIQDYVCGGEGFWFVRSPSGWKLKRHATLWQGSISPPFWDIPRGWSYGQPR